MVSTGSPITRLAWAQRTAASRSVPGSGVSGRASRMRRISTRAFGKAVAASAMTARNVSSTVSGASSGIMRRSRRRVTRSGTTLVLMPPLMRPTVSCGEPMPPTADTVPA